MSKVKKVLRIKIGLTQQDLSLCVNKKSYHKEMSKLANIKNDDLKYACCTTIFGDANNHDRYVIGINTDLETCSDLQLRALLVHELNHAVTKHMLLFSFNCDEYRSTLLQQLYIDTMPFLENYLKDKK